MIHSKNKKVALASLALTVAFALLFTPAPRSDAADHVDAPGTIQDRGSDIGDIFMFLDPNDNSRVVLAMNIQNFIIPGEVTSQVTFDHNLRYRIEIENTGDAQTDLGFNFFFSRKLKELTSQTATIQLPNGQTFTALTTPESIDDEPNPPIITTNAASGAVFFAGETDDPFFLDVPAVKRYARSAEQNPGNPDRSFFQRGRDTYAGFNTLHIVISVPVAMLRGNSSVIGGQALTERRTAQIIRPRSNIQIVGRGRFLQVDRAGIPTINPDIIPFPRKDEYNASTPVDDAAGRFVDSLVMTFKLLGTDDTHINILLNLVQRRGDILRLDTSVANSGPEGGTNPAAAYPNGRRPADDVIRTNLTTINNSVPLDDSVPSNDVTFRNTFPFFAPPQQPRPPGTIDDNTRN